MDRTDHILKLRGYLEHNSHKMEDIALENLKPGKLKPKKACVIMVGSTNTGKSTTVNVMTKSKHCTVGKDDQAEPCTQKLDTVEDKDTGLVYMDNPGRQCAIFLSYNFCKSRLKDLFENRVFQDGMILRSQTEQPLETF